MFERIYTKVIAGIASEEGIGFGRDGFKTDFKFSLCSLFLEFPRGLFIARRKQCSSKCPIVKSDVTPLASTLHGSPLPG